MDKLPSYGNCNYCHKEVHRASHFKNGRCVIKMNIRNKNGVHING